MSPFFSIIVVSLNAEGTIAKTIQSILDQTFLDYEVVVKDGKSADKTLAHIPKSERIKVYQSQDTGVYDAMNQAILLSNGQHLCFLNCGDVFPNSNVLEQLFSKISRNQVSDEPLVVYSDYIRKGILFRSPAKLTDFYLFRTPLNHQSMFYSAATFRRFGGYMSQYGVLADHELTMRLYRQNVRFLYIDVISSDYLGGGISEAPMNKLVKHKECNQIRMQYFSKLQLVGYSIVILFTFKRLREMLISDKSPRLIRAAYRIVVNLINRL